jgi:hypothetical protein
MGIGGECGIPEDVNVIAWGLSLEVRAGRVRAQAAHGVVAARGSVPTPAEAGKPGPWALGSARSPCFLVPR